MRKEDKDFNKELEDSILKAIKGRIKDGETSDQILSRVKMRLYGNLIIGGLGSIISLYIYKISALPIFTTIISGGFLILGMITHFYYNKAKKIVDKYDL